MFLNWFGRLFNTWLHLGCGEHSRVECRREEGGGVIVVEAWGNQVGPYTEELCDCSDTCNRPLVTNSPGTRRRRSWFGLIIQRSVGGVER